MDVVLEGNMVSNRIEIYFIEKKKRICSDCTAKRNTLFGLVDTIDVTAKENLIKMI
jgi:hypothetical protein